MRYYQKWLFSRHFHTLTEPTAAVQSTKPEEWEQGAVSSWCLGELSLSMAFPPISRRFKDTFVNVVGHRIAERSLQLGSLHPAPEAHKLGLVDELVPEEKLMEKAAAVMAQWLALPGKPLAEAERTWEGVGGTDAWAGAWELCDIVH